MYENTIRWAIMGTGYIANRFARGMTQVKDATLCAVVSRDEARGRAFAEKYGGAAVYTDLNLMLLEESPDVLYIGTPNDCHYAAIVAALNAGVNVLSEKPMVDNRRQWNEVTALASEKDLFLMEGMWTRCFPAVRRARQWIAEGRIGKPLTVRAFFEMHANPDDWQWWKAGIAHAGGALRDVGIYSLAMADMVFGRMPAHSFSAMESNGEVDQSFHMLLGPVLPHAAGLRRRPARLRGRGLQPGRQHRGGDLRREGQHTDRPRVLGPHHRHADRPRRRPGDLRAALSRRRIPV